jgi:putative transposase
VLNEIYPIVFLDCIVVKSREDGKVANRSVYLALENISKKWTMPIRCWKSAMNQFAIKFSDRMGL